MQNEGTSERRRCPHRGNKWRSPPLFGNGQKLKLLCVPFLNMCFLCDFFTHHFVVKKYVASVFHRTKDQVRKRQI